MAKLDFPTEVQKMLDAKQVNKVFEYDDSETKYLFAFNVHHDNHTGYIHLSKLWWYEEGMCGNRGTSPRSYANSVSSSGDDVLIYDPDNHVFMNVVEMTDRYDDMPVVWASKMLEHVFDNVPGAEVSTPGMEYIEDWGFYVPNGWDYYYAQRGYDREDCLIQYMEDLREGIREKRKRNDELDFYEQSFINSHSRR